MSLLHGVFHLSIVGVQVDEQHKGRAAVHRFKLSGSYYMSCLFDLRSLQRFDSLCCMELATRQSYKPNIVIHVQGTTDGFRAPISQFQNSKAFGLWDLPKPQ